MKLYLAAILMAFVVAPASSAQDVQKKRRDAVLNDKKQLDLDDYWVYDDFEKGRKEAEKTGKPMPVSYTHLTLPTNREV